MKKLFKLTIVGIILILSLTSCGNDVTECYNVIKERYPKAEIIPIPSSSYRYIVITDYEMRYVTSMSTWNTGITTDMPIMTADRLREIIKIK